MECIGSRALQIFDKAYRSVMSGNSTHFMGDVFYSISGKKLNEVRSAIAKSPSQEVLKNALESLKKADDDWVSQHRTICKALHLHRSMNDKSPYAKCITQLAPYVRED